MSKQKNYCKIEDCERQICSRDLMLCLMHYKRYMKHGSAEKYVKPLNNKTCSFEECTVKHDSLGFCANHARQFRKFGHPLSKDEKHKNLSEAGHNRSRGITSANKLERTRFSLTIGREVLARDNYTCQVCLEQSRYLHVDHLKGWSEYPELRFEPDNCRTVCRPCHYYITFKKEMPFGSKWGIKSLKEAKYYGIS